MLRLQKTRRKSFVNKLCSAKFNVYDNLKTDNYNLQ